jgi:L-amino acid N-acyltransferase YncA
MEQPRIRAATGSDLPSMVAIYNHYVRESVYTFEEQELSAEQLGERWRKVTEGECEDSSRRRLPWLVAETVESQGGGGDATAILGYAYADLWKPRTAYCNSVEVTIYLHPDALGRGLGQPLYRALLDELRNQKLHSAMASIALPNPASVKLHQALGFSKIGQAREIGRKFDRWVDVGYWQLMLQAPTV